MKVTWNSSSSWKGQAEKHPEELLTCGSDTTGHLLLGLRKIPLEERCAEGWCWNRQPAVTSCCYGCHCWPEPFWRVLLELWVTFLACIKENSKRNKSYNDTQIPSSWSSRESSRMRSKACLYQADPRFVFSFSHSGKSYLTLGRQYIWIRTGLKINTPKIFLLVLFVCSRVWTSTALPRTIARCAAGGQCQRLAPGGAVPPLRSQRGAAPALTLPAANPGKGRFLRYGRGESREARLRDEEGFKCPRPKSNTENCYLSSPAGAQMAQVQQRLGVSLPPLSGICSDGDGHIMSVTAAWLALEQEGNGFCPGSFSVQYVPWGKKFGMPCLCWPFYGQRSLVLEHRKEPGYAAQQFEPSAESREF